jgi:hypothetical protein
VATPIERFTPSHLPAVRRFCERMWQRPTSDDYYDWRYLEAPLQEGYLAVRDGEVLATLWYFRRPWRLGARTVHFLEVFDWFALPEVQRAGLGVRALQAAMKDDDPCILIGGTEETQSLLPRLKWQVVGRTVAYALPLGAGALVDRVPLPGILARPAAALAVAAWFRPRPRPVAGDDVVPTGAIGPEIDRLYQGELAWGSVPLWPAEQLRWLSAGHPSTGHFVPLYFVRGDRVIGWSLVRIRPSASGQDADLVELYAADRDEELLAWMIAETARRVVSFGVGMLRASSACPVVQAALRRNRFRRGEESPIQVWSNEALEMPEPMLVGANTNDNPYLPNPPAWF